MKALEIVDMSAQPPRRAWPENVSEPEVRKTSETSETSETSDIDFDPFAFLPGLQILFGSFAPGKQNAVDHCEV